MNFVLHGFAIPYVTELLPTLAAIRQAAPFRHLMTPGGVSMSVGLTNCGQLGWTSNRYGYRYTATDPDSGQPHGQRCQKCFCGWRRRQRRKPVSIASRRTPA